MYETLEIPRFVGQTISEPGEVGGGGGGGGGCGVDFFLKNVYSVYPGNAYR